MFPCLTALLALVGLLGGWLVDPHFCVAAPFFLCLRFSAPLSTFLTTLFLLCSLEVAVQGPRLSCHLGRSFLPCPSSLS